MRHALQTNGTLLDDDWARFLKEHGFLVGLSIDGPKDIHDHYRITKKGEPTFDRVYDAAATLRRSRGASMRWQATPAKLNVSRMVRS